VVVEEFEFCPATAGAPASDSDANRVRAASSRPACRRKFFIWMFLPFVP
jgi:hypothetical protein